MAIDTANMGLRAWNSGGDFWNYIELANNWTKVDEHDHTPTKGVQIPTGGIANLAVTTGKIANDAVDSSKLGTNAVDGAAIQDNAVTSGKISALAVTNAKIADATIADGKLASPVSGTYRYVFRVAEFLASGDASAARAPRQDGSGLVSGTAIGNPVIPYLYIDPADYAVAGKSTKWRLRCTVLTNTIALTGVNIRASLVALTSGANAAGQVVPTFNNGSPIGGQRATVTAPPATSVTTSASADFDIASAGAYLIAIENTATITTNGVAAVSAVLQFHYV